MLIDASNTSWLSVLDRHVASAPTGVDTFLLIDGVFIPGLFRSFRAASARPEALALLFEGLPGCTDDTRDVSPFLVPYDLSNRRFASLLRRCSGWPMVSCIQTRESLSALTARLGAWCVIEADELRFNLRFPDTRRLPGIFSVLTQSQRGELAGPATHWFYLARDGGWKQLDVPVEACPVTAQAALDSQQFAALVRESEADEILLRLSDRGMEMTHSHSERHAFTAVALKVAAPRDIKLETRIEWCKYFLSNAPTLNTSVASSKLESWLQTVTF